MHPRIREVMAFLDEQRAGLWRAVDDVPTAWHERRPASGWSMAAIIEHLGLVEVGISRRVTDAVAAKVVGGLGRETSEASLVEAFDVSRFFDRTTRIAAPEPLHPRGDMDMLTARRRLDDVRQAFRRTILAYDGLALGEVTLPHGRLGELNVYEWLLFMGAHEGRHAAQVRAVAAALEAAAAQ